MDVPFVDERPEAGEQLLVEEQKRSFPSFLQAMKSWTAGAAENLALTAVYVGCGKFGLSLAFDNASASVVWPPTGAALAALLVRGYRLWPGVFLGAFLMNITTQGSLGTTFGIAVGNACEAIAGAWLVRQFAAELKAFTRTRTFFRFVVLAGMVSTTISPLVGVTSLCIGGFAPWKQYRAIWLSWWLGDMVSDLIVAPLLLIWCVHGFPRMRLKQALEAASLLRVSRQLGDASTLDEALTHILESICATFRRFLWDLAAFRTVDEIAQEMIMDLHGAGIDIRNARRGGVLVTLIFKAEPDQKP